MLSTIIVLGLIFVKVSAKNKSQRKFLEELFTLLPSIRGRGNFCNLARYSKFNETTFRRNFSKFSDWPMFNCAMAQLGLSGPGPICIAAVDASFISKAGKKTFGPVKSWPGCANATKKGLGISALALIEVTTGMAWALDVAQTPAGLSAKEGKDGKYTRTGFYIEQIWDCLPYPANVLYLVAGGHYAKKKMFDALSSVNRHLIARLRPDANMKYLFDRAQNPGAHGNKKYDGKVDWKNLDLNRWVEIGPHPKYGHLPVYTQELYSAQFKRKLKVVVLINTRNGKYVLLASTGLRQSALEVVQSCSLRFQIEFLFRDAKQFTGLDHCRARDGPKLGFHFNMSLAAVNLFQLQMKLNGQKNRSMGSFIRKAYNTKLVSLLFGELNPKAGLAGFFGHSTPCCPKNNQFGAGHL